MKTGLGVPLRVIMLALSGLNPRFLFNMVAERTLEWGEIRARKGSQAPRGKPNEAGLRGRAINKRLKQKEGRHLQGKDSARAGRAKEIQVKDHQGNLGLVMDPLDTSELVQA